MKDSIWLIGASPMALEYAKVLDALNVSYEVIGRGETSATEFEIKCGHPVRMGGHKKWIDQGEIPIPATAIVAVGVEQLASVTIDLLRKGVKHILVEKPAGLNAYEINRVANETEKHSVNVYIAYNRRFYASVHKAREIIADDGGVTSFNFEFTEWSHEIVRQNKVPGIKENWFLANSTHVVDLAFYLGGEPQKISSYTAANLNWHPKASIFAGAGITENGALFSYYANWESAGRWSVEMLTKEHRLIFQPLEKLQIQKRGSIQIDFVDGIDYSLDERYKPGLYLQTANFLNGKFEHMIDIYRFNSMINVFYKMANYQFRR